MSDDIFVNLLFLLSYSFLGWCCEVVFCSIQQHRLINRGFLNGPICPIYGFGAVAVILSLSSFVRWPWLVFLAGMALTTLLEYFTSYAMEKIFHARWWDYSDQKFNIKGRICLLNSTLFGLLCLALIYGIHPLFNQAVNAVSHPIRVTLVLFLYTTCTVDLVFTVRTVLSLDKTMEKLKILMHDAQQSWQETQERLKADMPAALQNTQERLQDTTNQLHERTEQVREKFSDYLDLLQENLPLDIGNRLKAYRNRLPRLSRSSYNRLFKAFPQLRFNRHPIELRHLRDMINRLSRR